MICYGEAVKLLNVALVVMLLDPVCILWHLNHTLYDKLQMDLTYIVNPHILDNKDFVHEGEY